ncbi:MAG: hypothetical protein QM667_10420 [Asticcacaulis sp.]
MLTVVLQLALPRVRRTDMALGVLAVGALIEVGQLFTGRSASIYDWLADAIGVTAAIVPSYVETFRHYVRAEQKGQPLPRRRAADQGPESAASGDVTSGT